MKNKLIKLILVTVCCLSSGFVCLGAVDETGRKTWDDYQLIQQRNIFSRTRVAWRPRDEREERPAEPVQVEKDYILRGISTWGDAYVAYIEQYSFGETQVYFVGDRIGDVTIKAIGLDFIEVGQLIKRDAAEDGSGEENGEGDADEGQVEEPAEPEETVYTVGIGYDMLGNAFSSMASYTRSTARRPTTRRSDDRDRRDEVREPEGPPPGGEEVKPDAPPVGDAPKGPGEEGMTEDELILKRMMERRQQELDG